MSLASQPVQEPRTCVVERRQERPPPLQTTPNDIVTAVDAHNAINYPSQYPPIAMPSSFAQAMQRSNSYHYASEPGHTSAWPSEPGHASVWEMSSNGHNTDWTPATSEETQEFFHRPPPVPPIPQLPVVLQHLRKETPQAPRRKPVPQMHPELDPEAFTGQTASSTAFPMILEGALGRADESVRTTPDTMPDLLSDDSSGSSGSHQLLEMVPRSVSVAAMRVDSSPERIASSSRPPLLRRPPMLQREPSRRWTTTASGSDARLRAALCAQEIVQTEENYRQALGQLLRGEAMTTPPKPLLALIPALLVASPRFQSPPQAGELAKTFLEWAPALECALLDWCYLAGVYFNPYGRSQSTSACGRSQSTSTLMSPRTSGGSPVSRGRRLSMAWGQMWDPAFTSAVDDDFKLVRDISSPIPPTSKVTGEGPRRRTLVSERSRRHSRALLFERLGMDSARSSPSVASTESSPATTTPKPAKKPTVADLAIQPTQRAVRYVLLFRELLAHTMQDDLHGDGPLVREALEEALRLAKACDAALAVTS
ncbi:hypothetical protein BKA62DRAFT_186056 [Auriculariales sp. MPI-PUGE-AT-0066]|nr:hypothetical protein BKA62DRAFT_186056 [Auriculariales sp. MPI-PUGE-AT-0066]